MRLVDERPNVELRRDADGGSIVVLAFPYDAHVVALVRRIPGRRFDWDRREWYAPVDDWAGVHVADVVDRFPELTTSAEVDAWLRAVERRWVGRITTARHDGRGWFALAKRAGSVPEALRDGAVEREDGTLLVPLTRTAAETIEDLRSARIDGPGQRCVAALLAGQDPVPPARLVLHHGTDGERLKLEVLWDPDTGEAFERLPGAEQAGRVMPLDPWIVDTLDGLPARPGGRPPRPAPPPPATASRCPAAPRTRSTTCARRRPRRPRRSAARARRPASRSPRSRSGSAASCSRSSGPASGTPSTRAARSSPTSRGSARRSRRSRRSRPTTPTRRS